MIKPFLSLTIWLTSLAICSHASAAITLSYSNPNPNPLVAGSQGIIDVFIRDDMAAASLDAFLVEFGLSGGPAGGLVFSATQSDAQLADPQYVFAGRSSAVINATPVGTVVDPVTYSGFDATNDGLGGAFPIALSASNQLLFRLDLNALAAGTYTLSASATNSLFLDGGVSEIPFSDPGTTITVAVPEPSTMLLSCFALAGMGYRRIRNR